MVRSEESKQAWNAALVAQDWNIVDTIETEWANPVPEFYAREDDMDDMDYPEFAAILDDSDWSDKDEAGLEEYEENKRRRIAEANEF